MTTPGSARHRLHLRPGQAQSPPARARSSTASRTCSTSPRPAPRPSQGRHAVASLPSGTKRSTTARPQPVRAAPDREATERRRALHDRPRTGRPPTASAAPPTPTAQRLGRPSPPRSGPRGRGRAGAVKPSTRSSAHPCAAPLFNLPYPLEDYERETPLQDRLYGPLAADQPVGRVLAPGWAI